MGCNSSLNHDDTKLLIEAYVRPDSGLGKGSVGAAAVECQPFAAALRQALPQMAGVVVFATSAVEDESRQRAPLTSIHPEGGQAIGDDSLVYHTVGHDYRVSAGSFFQTNRYLIDKLVQIVVSSQTGRAALDLYAGAGLSARNWRATSTPSWPWNPRPILLPICATTSRPM